MHESTIDTTKELSLFKIIPFTSVSANNLTKTKNLNELIQSKIGQRQRFFGIEISPASHGPELDYNRFGKSQPLFTSITWILDHNTKNESLSMAPAVKLAHSLEKWQPVLSHITCYKMNENRLIELLDNNLTNFLALKGDSGGNFSHFVWITVSFFQTIFIVYV